MTFKLKQQRILFVLTILFFVFVTNSRAKPEDASDGFDAEDDVEDIDVSSESESTKEKYVPLTFQRPDVVEDKFYLLEMFEDVKAIGNKWLKSESKKEGAEEALSKYNGEWLIGSPTNVILENDYGLIVRTKARHHAISTKLQKPFKFEGKPLVVQYEVKYEEGQECGGGYIKLLTGPVSDQLKDFNDKTPYVIMFGPDKCGMTSKIHLILKHKNPINGTVNEHHAKQSSKSLSNYFEDKKTHLYTMVIRPDNTYRVAVDHNEIMSGSLLTDLEPAVTPPKQIADPADRKPNDWDDREKIVDPEAKKPDDWDEDQPKEVEDTDATKPDDWLEEEELLVPDPEAKKPDDWDDEMDGEWEAKKIPNPKCKDRSGCGKWKRPMKANPNFKGKWTAPMIKNPSYKGVWTPRLIDNPAYFEANPYEQLQPIGAVGIELWTMSSGIVFDNIILTDDESVAEKFAKQTFDVKQAQEAIYKSATGESKSFLQSSMDTLEEKPWLWAVLIVSVLVPIILVFVFCFGRKSTPSAHSKKTDEPTKDDEEEVEGEEEALEDEAVDEQLTGTSVPRKESSASSASRLSSSPVGARVVEKEQQQEDESGGPGKEEDSKTSPRQRRVRPRRAD